MENMQEYLKWIESEVLVIIAIFQNWIVMIVQDLLMTKRKKKKWTIKQGRKPKRKWIDEIMGSSVEDGTNNMIMKVIIVVIVLFEDSDYEKENQAGEAAALGRLGMEEEARVPLPSTPSTNLAEALKNENVRNEIIERLM